MSIVIDGKEYYGIIYKIENTENHKIYIGQTTNPRGFKGRYSCDGIGAERVYRRMWYEKQRGVQINMHLFKAFEKYGTNTFIVDEVLDTALTAEELNEKEIYYIAKFNSYHNGYNMSIGADNVLGMSGELCHNSKRVCQLSLDGKLIKTWSCANDASNALGITPSSISIVCKGNSADPDKRTGRMAKTAGGFVWVLEKDYDPTKDYSRVPQKKDMGRGTKPVLWLDDDGNVIQEFYSLNSVSEVLDICPQTVSDICRHKIKNGRYNLVFKSEYMGEQRLNVRELCEAS